MSEFIEENVASDSKGITGGGGGTTTESFQSHCLRLHVPTGASELTLGYNDDKHLGIQATTRSHVRYKRVANEAPTKDYARTKVALGVDDRGFVGVLTHSHHGNIYLCATGQVDIGTEYQHTVRVGAIVDTSVNLVRNTLMLLGHTWYGRNKGKRLPLALSTFLTLQAAGYAIASPMSGGVAGGLTNIDYLKTGHVGLFGSRSVRLQSIESIASSSALTNSHSGGMSASLNSVVAASINSGAVASVNGAFSASVNGATAGVVGRFDAALVARDGWSRVEGQSIRIGNKHGFGNAATWVGGEVLATNDVWVRAKELIDINVSGTENDGDLTSDGHLEGIVRQVPTGLQIVDGAIRASTGSKAGADSAALNLTPNAVDVTAEKSLVRMDDKGLLLTRTQKAVTEAMSETFKKVRMAYNTAFGLSAGTIRQVKTAAEDALAASVVVGGALSTIGAVAAKAATANDGDGASRDATITAGVIGALAPTTVIATIVLNLTGQAHRAGQLKAQQAYAKAVKTSIDLEKTTATTTVNPFAGALEITDDKIEMRVGDTKLTLTATGVTISAPKVDIKTTGGNFTVNDMQVML